MSKHGYTVEHGWFSGVCSGQKFAPMQKDRSTTDKIVSDIRAQVVELRARVAGLTEGSIKPETALSGKSHLEDCRIGRKTVYESVPFDQAPKQYQEKAVKEAIFLADSKARAGESIARDLETLATLVHGQPLQEVTAPEAAKPILKGEKRRYAPDTRVLTASYQEGARVYYTYDRDNGTKGSSWVGSSAWRRMELISE
jgi:hypothetical protein